MIILEERKKLKNQDRNINNKPIIFLMSRKTRMKMKIDHYQMSMEQEQAENQPNQ